MSRSKAARARPQVDAVALSLSLGPEVSLAGVLRCVDERHLPTGAPLVVTPSPQRALSAAGAAKLAGRLKSRGLEFVWPVPLNETMSRSFSLTEIPAGTRMVWLYPMQRATSESLEGWVELAQSLLSAGYEVTLELCADEETWQVRALWHEVIKALPELNVRIVPSISTEIGRSSEIACALLAVLKPREAVALGFPQCLVASTRLAEPQAVIGWRAWQAAAATTRLKPPACAGCDLHVTCSGVAAETLHAFGDAALVPSEAREPVNGLALRGVPIAPGGVGAQVAETERLDISPRYPDTSLVTLIVPGCDLNCVFCEGEQPGVGLQPSTLLGVRAALVANAGRSTGVFFTGGEPTQLPWLLDALMSARELGYTRIQMQSHAGRAREMAFARALVDAGLTAIDVPLYGSDAQVHEEITNTPGSFEATLEGIKNLKALGVKVVLHATLFRSNLPTLTETLAFMASLEPSGVYLQVTGEVGYPGTYERVAPRPLDVASAVARAIEAVQPTFQLRIADVPLCLLNEHAALASRWRDTPRYNAEALVLPFSEWLSTFSAGKTRDYAPSCATCSRFDRCDGVSREALMLFGESELRPS